MREDAKEEARKEENGDELCKSIGSLVNQRGKGGPLPVFLDRTFLETLSSYFYYSHFTFLMPNSLSLFYPAHKTHIHDHNILPSFPKYPPSNLYLLSSFDPLCLPTC